MKVLVTGGSGRLGRWLVPELVQEGHEVTVGDLIPPKGAYHFLHIDMLNLGELDWALSGMDTVVHLAAIPNIFHDIMSLRPRCGTRSSELSWLPAIRRLVLALQNALFTQIIYLLMRIIPATPRIHTA
jgi:hypothetical protein